MKFEDKKEVIVVGDHCGDCFYWQNKRNSPYNRVHESVKQCHVGNVVKITTRTCEKFKKGK